MGLPKKRRSVTRGNQTPGPVTNPGAAFHVTEARVARDLGAQAAGPLAKQFWQGFQEAHAQSAYLGKLGLGNPVRGLFAYTSTESASRAYDSLRARGWKPELPRYDRVRKRYLVRFTRPGKMRDANPSVKYARWDYCPERVAPKGRFDPRSFRTVRSDGHFVTVGCEKGEYDAKRLRCKVGTRAQRILHPKGEKTCPLTGRERRNPPMAGVEIYGRVDRILATKGPRGRYAGQPFTHCFTTRARILGLPDGRLLIEPAPGRR